MNMPPVVPPPVPSRKAGELGDRLKQTIDDYRRDHPEMTEAEIRQALEQAKQGNRARSPPLLALLLVGFALLGVLVFRLVGRVLPAVGQAPILTVAVVVAILGIAIVALFRRR